MLPGGDVGASYKNVKCRTPANAHIAGKIDNITIGSLNFCVESMARRTCREAVGFPIPEMGR